MQLKPESSVAAREATPWSTWITSAIFSLAVLAGHRVLEEREFLPIVATLGVIHVGTVIARYPRFCWHLLLSQIFVAMAAVGSVVLHTWHAAGPAPPGWSTTFSSFLHASLTSPSTYLYFTGYVVAFCVVLALLLLGIKYSRLRAKIDGEVALVAAYAMSSVNVAFDYSLTRPLYHVSGEPDAVAFFFTAGLLGMEFSLPLHVGLLALCICWRYLGPRPTQAPRRRGTSSASTAATR